MPARDRSTIPTAQRARTLLAGLALLALALAATSCGSSDDDASAPEPRPAIRGTVQVTYDGGDLMWLIETTDTDDYLEPEPETPCPALPTNDAAILGSQVEILDDDGTIVGVGQVSNEGTWQRDADQFACAAEFAVDDLPASDFYKVRIEGAGDETFPSSDIADPVELTIAGSGH